MDKALADAPDGQISLTDPDACAMATSVRNSGLVSYNAQCAVDTETHIIVTHDVTNKGRLWDDQVDTSFPHSNEEPSTQMQ